MNAIKRLLISNLILILVVCSVLGAAIFLYLQIREPFFAAKSLSTTGATYASVFPVYGQIGDYFGGLLNPIFGFLTVCLLVWSIRMQYKELSLTREELERSAIALDAQVKLSKNEYDRKQLEDSCNYYFQLIDTLFDKKVIYPPNTDLNVSLYQMLHNPELKASYTGVLHTDYIRNLSSENHETLGCLRAYQVKIESRKTLWRLIGCIKELGLNYLQVDALKEYWTSRAAKLVSNANQLGLIDQKELDTLMEPLSQIQTKYR